MIQLSDGGSRASILDSQGFNCFEFQAAVGEATVDVIWAEDEHAGGQCRPSGGGIPLLFPFPGRIGGASLSWEGRTYELEPADGRGNAIHGFAYDRPWRVVRQSAAEVTAEFQLSVDAEDCVSRWPSDFSIQVRYQLRGPSLRCDVTAVNRGPDAMPAGFGAHPYFHLPAGEDSIVRLPVSTQWSLDEMLPTGDCRDLADAEQFQQGRKFAQLEYDDVFGGLLYQDDVCRASVAGVGSRIDLTFGRPFREIVVYTPGHRKSFCIEPYSCVPGDVALGERAGWNAMAPGEQRQYWFEITASRPV